MTARAFSKTHQRLQAQSLHLAQQAYGPPLIPKKWVSGASGTSRYQFGAFQPQKWSCSANFMRAVL